MSLVLYKIVLFEKECLTVFVNCHYSTFLYQSIQKMVLNAIRFLLCNLIAEMESRTEGSRPRLRTQKKSKAKGVLPRTALLRPRTRMLEAKAMDQEHKRKCSSKKNKKVFKIFFQVISKKTVEKKVFQPIYKILTIQGSLRGLEALRPTPKTSKCVLEAKNVLGDSTSV